MTSSDIDQVIASYTPNQLPRTVTWADIAPIIRDWVRAAAPSHHARARQLLSAATQLVLWCLDEAIPVTTKTALRTTTIERFCAVAERSDRFAPSTRATIRARLRCLAAAQHIAGNSPDAPTVPRARLRTPYCEADIAALWQLSRAQPSPVMARRLRALLAGGLGAGCAAEDFRRLRPQDVRQQAGLVTVALRGPRPRTVPVLDRYADALLGAARDCDEPYLIGGKKPTRRSVTTGLLHGVHTDPHGPDIVPGRLRSTWLLTHLELGTRLDALMHAAGLTSATSIVDLVRHLPTLREDEQALQLSAKPQVSRLTPPKGTDGEPT